MFQTSYGALKGYYSVPRYHTISTVNDTIRKGSVNASVEFNDSSFFAKHILPTAWRQYDSIHGFDNVKEINDSSSFIDAQFWIDSLLEVSSSGSYTANIGNVRGDSGLAFEGYITYFFGQIRFPKNGTWKLISNGDDGGTVFSIDKSRDLLFTPPEISIPIKREDSLGKLKTPWDITKLGKNRILILDSIVANTPYPFQAKYYNYSGSSFSGLFWKHSEDSLISVVPASAFGKRRNYGAPVPEVVKISKNGTNVPLDKWGFIEVRPTDQLQFSVSHANIKGLTPKYVVDFGDGTTVTSTKKSFSHSFKKSGFFHPRIVALWGERRSLPFANRIVVFVK